MRSPNWPCQLISGSSNRPATLANGCIISRLPTSPDELARPSGWAGLAESSSSRGVPIALAARTTTLAGSKCSPPSRSIQVAPVARPARVGLDPADAGAGDEPRAERDRLRPVGQVGRRLGALVAARLAGAPLDARPAAVVGDRVDRVELRPPVPAELRVAAGDLQPGRPDRQRRHRRVLGVGRVGRVARQAGDAELAVGPVEVRQQLEVVDRPVVGDAVERADAEVGRQRARPGAGEDDRRAADRVVHERRDRRVVLDDRVVLREAADVRAGRPVLAGLQLPVELVARIVGAVEPAALLQADDLKPGLGQAQGHDAAGRAGADDQDVRGFGGQDCLPPASSATAYSKPFHARRRAATSSSSADLQRGTTRSARSGRRQVARSRRAACSGRRTWAASSTPRIRRHSLSRTR